MSTTPTAKRPTAAFAVALVVGAVLSLLLTATPAGAQVPPGDPYGSTTTEGPGPQIVPTCELGLTAGAAGSEASVHVTNVPFGATVRVLLGGVEVGRGTAPLQAQAAGAPVALGGQALTAQAAATSLEIPFIVPDLAPGLHLITAVGADFTLTCDPSGTYEVLAGSASNSGSVPGFGSLPRTGVYTLLLIAAALALLVIGRVLLEASGRREQAAAGGGPSRVSAAARTLSRAGK